MYLRNGYGLGFNAYKNRKGLQNSKGYQAWHLLMVPNSLLKQHLPNVNSHAINNKTY